jgi:hypothetical protein
LSNLARQRGDLSKCRVLMLGVETLLNVGGFCGQDMYRPCANDALKGKRRSRGLGMSNEESARERESGMAVRLTVNLSDEVAQALRELAEKRGTTVSEALRRAISTEKFINDKIEKGERVLLEDPDGNKQREIVFR